MQSVKTHIASFPELFFLQPQQHSLFPFYCNLEIFISAFEGWGFGNIEKDRFAPLNYFLNVQKRVYSVQDTFPVPL